MLSERYQRFLTRLRPPIGPASSHVHFGEAVRVAPLPWSTHVIARSLCRFRYIPFAGLAGSDRLGHIQVQLRAWAPIADADFALVLGEQGAMVFAWDRPALVRRCELAGLGAAPERAVPESLLLPARRDGAGLHRTVDGFEGQVWRAGELVQSRWWASMPDADAWLNFQRSAQLPPAFQVALPGEPGTELVWSSEPWGRVRMLDEWRDAGQLMIHQALAAAALLLMIPTLWLLKGWVATSSRVEDLEQARRHLEADSAPLMRSREEAFSGLASLEQLLSQVGRPTPVALLAHLSRQLPDDGTVLREIEWQGQQLRLVLVPPAGASRTAYVKALEGGGWLREVHEVAAEQGMEGGAFALVAELAVGKRPGQASAAPGGAEGT